MCWRRMPLWAVLLVLVAGVVLADEPAEAQKHKLAYRFTSNQVVGFRVEQEQEFRTQYEAIDQTDKNSSQFRRHFRVVSVDEAGNAELETMIDWAHMTTTSTNGKSVVFKSDDPQFHHPKFAHILESIGKPQATVKVAPSGRTLKVTPTKDANLAERAKADPTASPEGYLSPLPEEPVALGEHWKERFDLLVFRDKLPVKIDMLRTYKLIKVEDGQATIEFRTTVLTPVEEPEIEVQLMQRETTGTIVFDMAQGQVTSRTTTVDKTVIGHIQGKGSLRAVSTYKESRSGDAVASQPSETTQQ